MKRINRIIDDAAVKTHAANLDAWVEICGCNYHKQFENAPRRISKPRIP